MNAFIHSFIHSFNTTAIFFVFLLLVDDQYLVDVEEQ